MTAPKSTGDEDPSTPQTPRRVTAVKKTTPTRKASAPGGDGSSKPTAHPARQRAATTRQPPTLLGDFLLGRQTPARVAADRQAAREAARQRRESLELLKQEMRQAAVQQVQAPGGVRDRVKKWQMANAAAMASADPFASPSEPSEVNIQVDEESVTEQDRMRIKMRQKPRVTPKVVVEQDTDGGETEKENHEGPAAKSPPKKRVVSDTNWVKKKKKSPPRKASPQAEQAQSAGSPLPKNFLSRPAANPSVSNKIKDWASKVETPDEPEVKRHRVSKSVPSGDGIRVRPMASDSDAASGRSRGSGTSGRSGSTHITVETTAKSRKSKGPEDDGIRITPQRKKIYQDDGIRVRPLSTGPPDNGGSVRSSPCVSDNVPTVRASSRQTSRRPSTRVTTVHRDPSPSERIEVIEEPESEAPETSTKISASTGLSTDISSKVRRRPKAKSHVETNTTMTGETGDASESESWTSGSDVESDMPSTVLPQSLAEIPFGYSAFSELDLAVGPGGRSRQRPQAKRQSSFKGATNVLKKAFTEGKKILSEKPEPPKPAHNRPPNIENWLKDTVDPFVEGATSTTEPEAPRKSVEKQWADEGKERRSTSSSRRKSVDTVRPSPTDQDQRVPESRSEEPPKTTEGGKDEATTPTSPGLKRSRATRVASSPVKGTAKKGFKDMLRDAFRGESSGHNPPPLEYSSYEKVIDDYDERDDEYQERRRSSGARRTPPPDDDDSWVSTETGSGAPHAGYPKRRPPTNGVHELSTIVSEVETLSTLESDITSMLSDSTVTQSTALTRSTAVSRRRGQKPGLKRRLTKHSDLMSALSLPDNTTGPSRSGSLRSARSVRRSSNHLDDATVEELLQEFVDDENLYQRELKTLVDGVIPVLLTQFVHNGGKSSRDVFELPSAKQREDAMSKAVVNMGIALEKLKNFHRRCPFSDIHRLPSWLESVHAIYENYLEVWRLGFQGIIVNLAPASPDDEDSLINAMPRNEQGDVLDENGERIDVAHLLKRPLVRIKWITKFIKGYRVVTGTSRYESLASKWESLQETARRRHKEENARAIDDDAIHTDTFRVRDLRTLGALDNVRIDRFRQVYAKDSFSLDLQHSNGQRLECQVEVISRDNQLFKSDPGDLLIRETGSEGRSWLLFPPILGGRFSARRGDDKHQLVVMIRGNKDEWFELITLTTDDEEQVLDWLNILGIVPEPPAVKKAELTRAQPLTASPRPAAGEIPLGERRRGSARTTSGSPEPSTISPSRYHQRTASLPVTPASTSPRAISSPSPERTPTQDSYGNARRPLPERPGSSDDENSRPLREDMRPDPLDLQKSRSTDSGQREDGAPPPPVHRTFSSKRSPTLAPPAEKASVGVRRRTSSPLKHEYHPSDVSSESSMTTSDTESYDSYSDESSDDELEAADMPDTAPAISIRKDVDRPIESEISESLVSLTPSASASQTGLPKFGAKQPEYIFQSSASISYWDNKHGCWKDLWPEPCSIITTPGLIEAYPLRHRPTSSGAQDEDPPLIALDLTPLVMLRNSTALDLEIRSPALSYARMYPKVMKVDSSLFRFRAPSYQECETLYMAVHRARMDNAKYKALEEETRVRAFGQNQTMEADGEETGKRRSWFGRKNSYRASARAPSQSAGSTSQSSVSASSFLRKLMGGSPAFNIAMSSVDRQSRNGEPSFYTSSSSSGTPPRSPSVSAANSGRPASASLTTNNLKIRLHLLVSASKWEDHGNCYLEVARPDQGTKQNLRKYQGMEKRIVVTSIPKKGDADKPVVVKLDVVLGSRCFSRLGSRGVLLNVWEEVKDESGETGVAPKGGSSNGNVSKWCFQCASVTEASWIFGLVTQEVVIG
ncbi:hypothetical protein F4778DRAFT_4758 [Xylariomycetidae sp. FL2044]|nr:hypothetical protein F4778DRAFT_4758 [Xylariomycetidae sp. FL2044]